MRILSVFQTYSVHGNVHPSKIGPIAYYLQNLGNQVTILAASFDRFTTSRNEEKGVEVIQLGSVMKFRFMTINPGLATFCLGSLRHFDVVHIYGLYDLLGPFVAWFCRLWKIPYVVEPMGMYEPIIRSIRVKKLYHKILGGGLIKGAARIVVTSDKERSDVIRGGVPEQKILVRRNGLDEREFESLPSPGRFRAEAGIYDNEQLILFVGRLSQVKGIDILIKAFARLGGPTRLVITGPDDGDGTTELIEELRALLDLGDRLLVTGPRFGREKLQLLVDADLFVLPSRSENFGNAPLEAAACGVPVIVSDKCGIAPYVKNNLGLVISLDENALVNAMQTILADKSIREGILLKSDSTKQTMSWKEPIVLQQKMYEQLTDQSN